MSVGIASTLMAGALTAVTVATAPAATAASWSAGQLDTSFAASANGPVAAVEAVGASKVLIGGAFTAVNGQTRNRIARLTATGAVDSAFNTTNHGLNSLVRAISVRPDGKILVGGEFTNYNGTNRPHVALLSSSGGLDSAFSPNANDTAGNSNRVLATLGVSSAANYVGGELWQGGPGGNVLKLQSDGSNDATFSTNWLGVITDYVRDLAAAPNNDVIAVGDGGFVQRYSSAGVRDATFFTNVNGGMDDSVHAVAVDTARSAIYIGGDFTGNRDGNVTSSKIAKLSLDGTIDSTFATNLGTGFNGQVNDIAVQPDGKLVVVGQFTQFNGHSRSRIARLHASGTLDTSFSPPGGGFDADARSVALVGSGSSLAAVVGGDFAQYGSAARSYIAKLHLTSVTPPAVTKPHKVGSAKAVFKAKKKRAIVTWRKPTTGSPAQRYQVRISHRGGKKWHAWQSTHKMRHVFKNIKHKGKHRVAIRAVNSAGHSPAVVVRFRAR